MNAVSGKDEDRALAPRDRVDQEGDDETRQQERTAADQARPPSRAPGDHQRPPICRDGRDAIRRTWTVFRQNASQRPVMSGDVLAVRVFGSGLGRPQLGVTAARRAEGLNHARNSSAVRVLTDVQVRDGADSPTLYSMMVMFSPPRRRSGWLSCWTTRPLIRAMFFTTASRAEPVDTPTSGRAVGRRRPRCRRPS